MALKAPKAPAPKTGLTPSQKITNFGLTGVACSCAQLFVHPVETIMVRQQLTPKGEAVPSMPVMFSRIFKAEGVSGLYRGISAGILRECSYSTIRFGLYEPIRDVLNDNPKANRALLGDDLEGAVRIGKRVLAGCSAGGLASALASPTDLIKISMQRCETLPVPSIFKYIRDIAGRPGGPIMPFYEGVSATVSRAVVLGATKMAVYNEIKDALKAVPDHPDPALRAGAWQRFVPGAHSWRDTDYARYGHESAPTAAERLGLVFNTAFAAGLAITITTSPFTNARTHIMSHPGKYRGLADALVGIVRQHGVGGLFRGFSSAWARFGPYALIQFVVWEQLRFAFGLPGI
mmetsp:Transcript_30319/g.96756  ORF Transcript_30319/g.96756 Transcript_30319/m.96756 type:complete len:347 (-) Transcript_30319:98-1138(-)|eukprot:CAMPEP_0118878596 /NCGR_PEP_ID=MMETSP1163-20130328/18506_1 /TAXON_ID=124430 /ORGANISM="Phaeomonas parva, Strain CCMP2877" /LENGTH=346 /DNA_ID=CAMNT_0006814489 /DNA_START=116 /DNA_END=1156 /DNA_ORIENTATION=+